MSEAATSPIEVVLRGPRWMRIALVASLALNLATFGVIIASIWQWRHLAHGMPFGFPAQLLEFSRTLPANRESELKGMVASSEPQIEPLREEARQARREAVRTFVSDPFDKDSFVAANGRLIEQELKVRQA